MRILMGTKNQGKIEGVKRAFERYFENIEIEGIAVDSEVSAQPINKEIIVGARNRVKNVKKYAKEHNLEADYYVASEAGITNLLDDWIDINAVVIENKEGKQSVGTSQGFPIDEKYIDEITSSELGKVMDRIFKSHGLNTGKGGISILTHDEISRIDLTENACMMALIRYINKGIWE